MAKHMSQEIKRQQCQKPGHGPCHYLGGFAFAMSLSGNNSCHKGASGPDALQDDYKRQPRSLLFIHFSGLLLLGIR